MARSSTLRRHAGYVPHLRRRRLTPLVAATCLAVGAGACGSDSDSGSTGGEGAAGGPQTTEVSIAASNFPVASLA